MTDRDRLTVGMYSFDCRDAAALAEFWSGVLERPVDEGATAAYATIGSDGEGPTWMFVRSEDPGQGRNRLMLDLGGEHSWREHAARTVALGATRIADHEVPGVARWIELRDPEDNTFRIFAPRPQAARDPDRGLIAERSIDATPDRVFDAFIDLYEKPHPDWVVGSTLDLRVGGEWRIGFAPPGIERFDEHRTFTRVDRPSALEYDVRVVPVSARSAFETHVAIEFEARDGGTLVRLEQNGFPDAATRDDFAEAWGDVLAQLSPRDAGSR